ncbi:MAG: transglutaminase domain-containing protein [bacterium]|nr:transglutaminase domain-containing protein [bacterium]
MIDTPISSCGALATLIASILRQMRYAVRLVHGDKPRADNHAWNEIWLNKEQRWQPFDCSSGSGNQYHISRDCTRILDCADWSEIKDFLLKEHKKNLAKHNKLALS